MAQADLMDGKPMTASCLIFPACEVLDEVDVLGCIILRGAEACF